MNTTGSSVELADLVPATDYEVEATLVFVGGGSGPPLRVARATLEDGEGGRESERGEGRGGGRVWIVWVGCREFCCVPLAWSVSVCKHTYPLPAAVDIYPACAPLFPAAPPSP